MNGRSPRLDDDGDLIAVTIAEPGHRPLIATTQRFDLRFLRPLRAGLSIKKSRPRGQDSGPRIDQHQAAANGGAGRPHSSHHGSNPLRAAGTLGAQPSVWFCLFDHWKRPFYRGRET